MKSLKTTTVGCSRLSSNIGICHIIIKFNKCVVTLSQVYKYAYFTMASDVPRQIQKLNFLQK